MGELSKAIASSFGEKLKPHTSYDCTYRCNTTESLGGNKYKVKYCGVEHTVYGKGDVPIGSAVWVCLPLGEWENAFISFFL